ncbi:MAG TPA: Bax inhibitor-1/YccA family protein [Solirubrobacteraceae bacterium]|nr:Bax inhibitor-1/YccA family protein [Solirubrobacteraceae bacterium]
MEFAAGRVGATYFQTFLQRVFTWMLLGLLTTGLVAAAIGASDSLLTDITETPGLVIGVIVAQLGLVLALSFGINRMSPAVATVLFFVYAALVGVTFAFVFELYTAQSIFTTFLITAAMFAVLAFIGATTQRDLTSLGTILFAALIALIIATVVNFFVASSLLYWITTYAGVLIFAGLTAYDMQKLKRYGEQAQGGEATERAAIIGALALYLDFINLFLYLLRIFGSRR